MKSLFSHRTARLVLASISMLPALAFAADEPLTLAEAQRTAVARSQQLVAQDAAARASREMAGAVGQLPDPVLKIGVDNLPLDGPDAFALGRDFMTMRRIGLMQELTRSDKRQLRSERFELEAEKTLAEKDVSLAAIQRDTALAWLDRYYAEVASDLVGEQAAEARLEIESAESAYRSGRGSQADVFAARGSMAALEDRAAEFRRKVRNAKIALGRWVGELADLPLAGKPAFDRVRHDLQALDASIAHHPQIASLAKQEAIAANEARQAEAAKSPDWSVELTYSQRGSSFSNMVSVGVSVPLQWDRPRRQEREIAARLATAEQMRAQREEMLRAHVAEAKAMVEEWESGRERLARYEKDLIPLARERTTASVAAYRGGKASLAETLSARRSLLEVRMQALQLELETARTWAQLNYLTPENGASHHAGLEPAGFPSKDSK